MPTKVFFLMLARLYETPMSRRPKDRVDADHDDAGHLLKRRCCWNYFPFGLLLYMSGPTPDSLYLLTKRFFPEPFPCWSAY